jgi:hypothetical protein
MWTAVIVQPMMLKKVAAVLTLMGLVDAAIIGQLGQHKPLTEYLSKPMTDKMGLVVCDCHFEQKAPPSNDMHTGQADQFASSLPTTAPLLS